MASDGGVFAFGDAAFYGSTGTIKLNKPIVLPENDIPVAVDNGPFTVEGGESITMKVLENDDLGDGKPQIRLVDPADGTPTDAGRITTPAGEFKRTNGGIGYTPAGGVTGAAEIQYVLIDEDGKGDTSNPATVTINVLNGAPKATNQSLAGEFSFGPVNQTREVQLQVPRRRRVPRFEQGHRDDRREAGGAGAPAYPRVDDDHDDGQRVPGDDHDDTAAPGGPFFGRLVRTSLRR